MKRDEPLDRHVPIDFFVGSASADGTLLDEFPSAEADTLGCFVTTAVERVCTTISVAGLMPEEAADGLPYFTRELERRDWILGSSAIWDPTQGLLRVAVEVRGRNPAVYGGFGGLVLDQVRDCVVACFRFSGDLGFEVVESVVRD